MIPSQDKPPSPSRRRWTAEEDSLLGTKSDRALARKFGRTVKAVKNRRRLKGVFLVHGEPSAQAGLKEHLGSLGFSRVEILRAGIPVEMN